ncbi:MAG: ATP-binding protein [Tepidisphaeraceae bacterium]
MTLELDQPRSIDLLANPPAREMSREEQTRRIEEMGRVILAFSDLTDRMQASHEQLKARVTELQDELGEKNRELERRNRLAALGEMAAGIAHEIRNPLGAIRLYASLLKTDVSDRPASAQTVDKIASAIARLETIVSGVLTFSRETRISRTETDLAKIVLDAIETATGKFGTTIEFACDGPKALPVELDETLIGQALLNLIVNAAEACEGSGRVSVQWGRKRGAGKRMFVRIRDSGPGIDAANLDRIFNPFFTTKDTGTGLGLAIVHRIIEAHDGSIRVSNCEEGGAEFEVTL